MKSKILLTPLILLFVILINSSCSKSDNPGNNGGAGGTGGTGSTSVSISNFAFSPASLSVKVGTVVKFTNSDNALHTATSDATGFDTGDIAAGASKNITFTTAGSFPYHCAYHSSMKGTITVTQ